VNATVDEQIDPPGGVDAVRHVAEGSDIGTLCRENRVALTNPERMPIIPVVGGRGLEGSIT
jgi:hypothetical protein